MLKSEHIHVEGLQKLKRGDEMDTETQVKGGNVSGSISMLQQHVPQTHAISPSVA